MEICATQVRKVSCVRCLHYEKCVRNAGSPVSKLGGFIAGLNITALKPIANELKQFCVKGLRLKAYAPNISELENGAFAVIRAYDEGEQPRLLFRLNLDGSEDEAALRTLIFNAYIDAYIKAKRNANNGTTTKA